MYTFVQFILNYLVIFCCSQNVMTTNMSVYLLCHYVKYTNGNTRHRKTIVVISKVFQAMYSHSATPTSPPLWCICWFSVRSWKVFHFCHCCGECFLPECKSLLVRSYGYCQNTKCIEPEMSPGQLYILHLYIACEDYSDFLSSSDSITLTF